MSSYYKKIDGKNYDRSMLDIAEGSVKGKGDGRISLADAKNMIKLIKDGGKITDIERRTLNYILENYKLTETALKHIEKSVSDTIGTETAGEKKIKKNVVEHAESTQKEMVYKPVKSSGKFFKFLIFLLLAGLSVFIFIKYFYKNFKSETYRSEIKDESMVTKPEESKTPPAETKAEKKPEKVLSENEYLVKENDTLIKISEALYGNYKKWEDIYKMNKGTLSNPTILYPGQVLKIPEKNADK